jgi:hypothetical protein
VHFATQRYAVSVFEAITYRVLGRIAAILLAQEYLARPNASS